MPSRHAHLHKAEYFGAAYSFLCILYGSLCMQALARDAGEESGNEGELAALADEADLPLDKLMALYGYVPGSDEPEEEARQPGGQSSAEKKQPGKQSNAVDQPEASTPPAMPMDVDSDDADAADLDAAEEKPGRDLADLMDKGAAPCRILLLAGCPMCPSLQPRSEAGGPARL